MDIKTQITSVSEWLQLSEPKLPILNNESEKGTIYKVQKVGFLLASKEDCVKAKIEAQKAPNGKYLLPTIYLEFGGKFELCRLPIELTSWAEQCVAMAHRGMNPFPSDVEFGILQGRSYAERL